MKAGYELLNCEPFAHVVAQHVRDRVCDFCMESAGDGSAHKKCSGCKLTYFCGVKCQRSAWTSYHKKECMYLRKIAPNTPMDTVRLIVRIILRLRAGASGEVGAFPGGEKRTFSDLMTHQKEIVADEKRFAAFLAFYETIKLCLGEKIAPNKAEALEIFGCVVINSFNIMDNDYQPIGIGLYLAASVLDHSCRPNASVVFHGKRLILRCIEDVGKCIDVRISYTNVLGTCAERRENLKAQYYFDCECSKCSEEGPENDEDKSSVLCPFCPVGCVPVSQRNCRKCGETCPGEVFRKHERMKHDVEEKGFDLTDGRTPAPGFNFPECFAKMRPIFHSFDKTLLGVAEVTLERHLSAGKFEQALEVSGTILDHYRRFYPVNDVNTALMEMKAAKLAAYLDQLDKAEVHLSKAKDILLITHGPSHPLLTKVWTQISQDVVMGRRELADIAKLKKISKPSG